MRPAASRALQLDLEYISEDCSVRMDVAVPYQLLQHGTPLEAQASKSARKDVRDSPPHSDIEENSSNQSMLSGSDASSSSETSSTVDAADCDSDIEELRDSYDSLQKLTEEMKQESTSSGQYARGRPQQQDWEFREGREGLTRFLLLPPTWPLARMLLPIKFIVKQAETLLQNYCFETIAACKAPKQQKQFVFQTARDLGQLMALRLAEIVTELMQSVLLHPAKGLVDESNAPLLTQRFWVQAIYPELLHASSRTRAQRGQEEKRPPRGLVKILCLPYKRKVQERYDRRSDCVVSTETLLGVSSWVDSMYVWFPAAWMPLVVDAVRAKNVWWDRLGNQQGAVAFVDPRDATLPETRELKYKYKKWPMDEEGHSPILDVRANVDWLTLDTRTFYHSFPRLYEGILNDAFTQKASMGWHPASPARVVVSLLLPGGLAVENWLALARQKRNMWPLQMTMHTVGCSLPTELVMRRERRRLKAKHLWAGLAPQWDNLRARLFSPCVTNSI